METYNNIEATARRLQKRFVSLKRRALGCDVLLGGVATGFLATVLITLGGWPVPLLIVYSVIGAAMLVIFGLLAWRIRFSAFHALIGADRTLHLQERLSTAYEYLQQQAQNPFVPPLAAEAAQLAEQVEPRVVFPAHMPRRVWNIPLLLAALVGFIQLNVAPLDFDSVTRTEVSREVAREGERLERWGRRLEQLAQQERLDRSLLLARHMQDLGRRLQRERGEPSQVTQRISSLSQYLQRMQQELQERALLSETGLMTAHDVLLSGKSVKQELRDILQLLRNETLPREMMAAAEQSLLRLRRQVGQNPELEQLLQNLRAGNVEAARRLLQDVLEQQQATEEIEHLERARRALEYSTRAIQRGESGETQASGDTSTGESSGHNEADNFDAGMMAEDMPGMEDFAAPGLDEGFGSSPYAREGPPRPLRESDQPASQVQIKSGEGAMRLSYVRYLPVQNEARAPIEQVVVRYQQAAEEVLTQEQIPWDYREQVKHYFLAIGMVPEARQ